MVKLTVCRVFRSIIINELNAVPSELVLHVYYNYIGTACLSCVLYEKKKKEVRHVGANWCARQATQY